MSGYVRRIARGPPSLSYFPIRGPRIFAPISAQSPPTICTAVEPAEVREIPTGKSSLRPIPDVVFRKSDRSRVKLLPNKYSMH